MKTAVSEQHLPSSLSLDLNLDLVESYHFLRSRDKDGIFLCSNTGGQLTGFDQRA